MTINEAINEVNDLKPNDYTNEQKIGWLYRLDLEIKEIIFDKHEYNDGETEPVISNYDAEHMGSTLLVPAPYDEIYVHYLAAQIDYYNREYAGFNNTNAMYAAAMSAFRNAYNSTHMPKTARKVYY